MELQPTAQHWGSINLIFKLSALKDKLQVTQLPGWTHTHHPWCQASTAQLHWQQLRSEPWLPGEPCLAGRSLPPQLVTAARQSLGCSSLLQRQKLCPKREGAVFCMPAESVMSQMGTWAKGMATSHSRMAQSLLSLLQPCQWGLCSAPQPEPTSRAKIFFTYSTSKITSGYNTVSNGSLHSSESDPEALMVSKTGGNQIHLPSSLHLNSAHLKHGIC